MTRNPRAKWTGSDFPTSTNPNLRAAGANDRLAALLPQLEAADELLAIGLTSTDPLVRTAAEAFLAARDAHLTEGTPE